MAMMISPGIPWAKAHVAPPRLKLCVANLDESRLAVLDWNLEYLGILNRGVG